MTLNVVQDSVVIRREKYSVAGRAGERRRHWNIGVWYSCMRLVALDSVMGTMLVSAEGIE